MKKLTQKFVLGVALRLGNALLWCSFANSLFYVEKLGSPWSSALLWKDRQLLHNPPSQQGLLQLLFPPLKINSEEYFIFCGAGDPGPHAYKASTLPLGYASSSLILSLAGLTQPLVSRVLL